MNAELIALLAAGVGHDKHMTEFEGLRKVVAGVSGGATAERPADTRGAGPGD